MKKKIIVSLIIVAIFVIVNVMIIGLLGNDHSETVEYDGNHNVIDNDSNNNIGEEPIVYMTTDISSESLVKIYEALNWNPEGNVAVKISTGEPPASNYLDPNLIADLVQQVDGTIVENNTAYGGARSSTAMHYQVAEEHGFTAIANVDILDEEGSTSLPVENGKHLAENLVGSHFDQYDSYLVLSHFKGHSMAGYGGAIKNISIGLASSEGKTIIHTANNGGSMWSADQNSFLESMAEAAKFILML